MPIQHLSSILPGKRRSTLYGYLAGCLVLRFQRSNGQIPGYQARTFPPARQRIAYRVQALGGGFIAKFGRGESEALLSY
jgi:hypothetical protein